MTTGNSSNDLTFFEIRVPKSSETSPEAMAACFQALPQIHNSIIDWFLHKEEALVFEIVTWNQRIYFLAGTPSKFSSYLTSQLTAQYPQALISPVADFLPYFFPKESTTADQMKLSNFGQITMAKPFYLPLKTYKDFTDIDPLSTVLGALAKADPSDKILVQYLITAPPKHWQNEGWRIAQKTFSTSDPTKVMPHPQKSLIEQKVAQVGFKVGIRLLVVNPDKLHREMMVTNLVGSFASITHGEGNSLKLNQPMFWQKHEFFKSILNRYPAFIPGSNIFTAMETATLYHLPNQNLVSIRNVAWGGTLKGEPPETLPIALGLTDEEKKDINFFGRTEFKNRSMVFGIKRYDRRKHMYIIGKTGTGKSTLIANMAINDMRNGEGLAIVDPHGDLCNIVLDYIPKFRLNDVVYLDPNNINQPFRMNPLEITIPEQSELVASGIVAIFHKLFAYSWGPRLEYILRNTIMSLTQIPNTTLLDVTKILTNNAYRNHVVSRLADTTLKNFWNDEFNKLDDRARNEAVSPILNKVGQFITSPKIRAILEHPHSSVDLDDIMNSGKILLLNLSQGRIGEDNAALLGAMFITKIQLAAMNRVNIPESERRDFFLYVDEFQNFATSSFVKILSEARKYRLNLAVANQYTAQVEEDVQKAIFGNVGTLISFLVGSADAKLLNQEFGNIYEESDLVNLDNFEVITKLSIDNKTSSPFPAKTLPLPKSINQNREKAIKLSLERYGKPRKIVEETQAEPLPLTPTSPQPSINGQKPAPNLKGNNPAQPEYRHQGGPTQPKPTTPPSPTPPTAVKSSEASAPSPSTEPLPSRPQAPTSAQTKRQQADSGLEKLTSQSHVAQAVYNNPHNTNAAPSTPKASVQHPPQPSTHQQNRRSNNHRRRNTNWHNRTQITSKGQPSNPTHTNSEEKLDTQSDRPKFVVEVED